MSALLFARPEAAVAESRAIHAWGDRLDRAVGGDTTAAIALARRTALTVRARTCPRCRTGNATLNGKDENGRQRFRCRGCLRTYNILTGTSMARARKPEKWGPYLACMGEHVSVRKVCATGIGLSHHTVWRWRHRFLKTAANDNADRLNGVIEADTILFRRSFKGRRRHNPSVAAGEHPDQVQPPGANQRGKPRRPVTVLTAIDSNDCILQKILTSAAEIAPTLSCRIAHASILRSRYIPGYAYAAAKAGAIHVIQTRPAGYSETTHADLARVDRHHRDLKTLIYQRCLGVATRYLFNYLGWHRAMSKPGFQGKALLARALA